MCRSLIELVSDDINSRQIEYKMRFASYPSLSRKLTITPCCMSVPFYAREAWSHFGDLAGTLRDIKFTLGAQLGLGGKTCLEIMEIRFNSG